MRSCILTSDLPYLPMPCAEEFSRRAVEVCFLLSPDAGICVLPWTGLSSSSSYCVACPHVISFFLRSRVVSHGGLPEQ